MSFDDMTDAEIRAMLKKKMSDPAMAEMMSGKDPDMMTRDEIVTMLKRMMAGKNALKAISETPDEYRVANYIVVFGGRDLEGIGSPNVNADGSKGEYFTKATRFESEYTAKGKLEIDWEHGRAKEIDGLGKNDVLGYVDWKTAKMDEFGVWVERVLSRRNKYIEWIKQLIADGLIGNSTETDPNSRVVKGTDGEIIVYPLYRDSFTVQPMEPRMMTMNSLAALKALGINIANQDGDARKPQDEATGATSAATSANEAATVTKSKLETLTRDTENKKIMDENKKKALDEGDLTTIKQMIVDTFASIETQKAQAAEAAKAEQAKIDAAVEKAREEERAKMAVGRRLPDGQKAPYAAKYGDTWKYDNLDPADNAFMIEVLNAGKKSGQSSGATTAALKALALKLEASKEDVYNVAKSIMVNQGVKANELNYSTQAGFGDEWVGVAYSTRLWEAIRQETFVAEKLMAAAIELPQGMESITLPLEGADLTWYKVAQTTATNGTTGIPDATITTSKIATSSKSLSLAKMGARGVWAGEMEEDSLIPFIANLRRQVEIGGAEQFEHAVIDGDTETGASTNINDIAGTPASTDLFLLVNGFRKSPLVTTTANSRSAGTLTVSDFLETVKLMGLGGKNANQKDRVEFILDVWTAWKALELPEIQTRDVFSNPTIENGELTSIFGYKVRRSAFMHFANADATYGLKANTAGKTDLDTAANNTTGSILAVRYDQWQMGLRRRMTIETQRIPQADATQIVALMRWGLTQRDTEASAISYNVTV